jgi:hypothetical protein
VEGQFDLHLPRTARSIPTRELSFRNTFSETCETSRRSGGAQGKELTRFRTQQTRRAKLRGDPSSPRRVGGERGGGMERDNGVEGFEDIRLESGCRRKGEQRDLGLVEGWVGMGLWVWVWVWTVWLPASRRRESPRRQSSSLCATSLFSSRT